MSRVVGAAVNVASYWRWHDDSTTKQVLERELKQTDFFGLPCGEYVIGGAQFGSRYGITNTKGKPPFAAVAQIIERAHDAGATVIDTAAAYGDSESRIGRLLAADARLRSGLWVITKLRPPAPRASFPFDEIPAYVRREIDSSLRRLNVSHLHLVLLHRASLRTEFGGAVWTTLKQLVREGVVGHLGVSVYGPDEALDALADPEVHAIQAPASVLDRRLLSHSVPQRCVTQGVGLFVRSVLLQGLLAVEDEDFVAPEPRLRSVLRRYRSACLSLGLTPREGALAYARSIPGVTGLVVGAESVRQVEQNLASWQTPALTDEQREELEAFVGEIPPNLVDPSQWKVDPPASGSNPRMARQ